MLAAFGIGDNCWGEYSMTEHERDMKKFADYVCSVYEKWEKEKAKLVEINN